MKTLLNRFVATVLLLFLSIMLCFQYPAMAESKSNAEASVSLPSRLKIFFETLRPSVANPEGSQPGAGESPRGNTGDRQGAGGRDA